MQDIKDDINIAIYSCDPRYSLAHMNFINAGKGFLINFLSLMTGIIS